MIDRSNRSDTPAQIPSGMPISSASSDRGQGQRERVHALLPQALQARRRRSPPTVSSATLPLPNGQATKPAMATTPSQPMSGSGRPKEGWLISCWTNVVDSSMTRRISLKKYRNSGLAFRLSPIAVVDVVEPAVQRRQVGAAERRGCPGPAGRRPAPASDQARTITRPASRTPHGGQRPRLDRRRRRGWPRRGRSSARRRRHPARRPPRGSPRRRRRRAARRSRRP